MPRPHALIVTALEVEFNAVVAHLESRTDETTPSGMVLEQGAFVAGDAQWPVTVVQIGAGNVGAALETDRAIGAVRPTHVFFVGVAGGIKDVQRGDVVAGEHVYQYESGKAAAEFLPRPRLNTSSYAMVHRARAVARNRRWQERIRLPAGGGLSRVPQAFVKPIAAGEKVVTSLESRTFRLIRETYGDALALEMEGYGFLAAIQAHQALERIVIRGISDMLEGKSASDEAGWQEIASATAAAFAFDLLATLTPVGIPGRTEHSAGQADRGSDRNDLSDQFWRAFSELAATLYPEGPEQGYLWSRSGGNPALLDLRRPGREVWFAAVRLLRQGGGGSITPASLIQRMREEYPRNAGLKRLQESI